MTTGPEPIQCAECGARYADDADSCAARFDALLALDHTRQEPWGSRHGLAFAAYALQHPELHAASIDRAWTTLHRVYVDGDDPAYVIRAILARRGTPPTGWAVPPRLTRATAAPAVTIADLGDFAPESYADRLDAWCRAALAMWNAPAMERSGA